ncbi:Uncharacterized conserved protein, AIM24 family [Haloechinothrix alba]|uniref:Uncharacterized conserved protein, AIM24 family n=1 Tax=Haloechinothrix alba TaxID=664784 RepID=A0A238XD21_9PSEU|nr:AIM24 family protein [Haloechinothrix alba]SNR56224.1 Uncharacterized conserved protein, AIM24 family [Haloechinothrix alba]
MEVHTRHTPWFGVARVVLSAGEAVRAEQRAMVATSFGVSVVPDGTAGRRAANPPTTFTAPAEGGWVDLAPQHPGDVYALELPTTGGWCVARDAVLASPATMRDDPLWSGFRQLFGAEPGFLRHVSGYGSLVLGSGGPVEAFSLEAGEVFTIAPAYLLGYPDAVQCRLRALDPAGPQSLRTGDGLVLDVAGPGTVLARTRRAAS